APGARAENLAEDVARIEARSAELEMRGARAAALAKRRERIAARSCPELLEARPAGAIDFAAVEGLALLLVANDLVGLVGLGKALLGLRIVRILVRMVLLGQPAIGRLDVLVRGCPGHAKHVIGITHICSLPEHAN